MKIEPDVVVCNANGSHAPGKAVYIHFEIMDPETFKSIGKAHNTAMTPADAVRLLGILEGMSTKYGWPKAGVPEVVSVPLDKQRS